jgi:tRNA(His) 5'-end guanylyltransferase
MKSNYESRFTHHLVRRIPVIMRLDGKAFHTYTKNLDRPFDDGLIEDMQQTAIYLCQNIQGAKCAYVQSDEISVLITDYDDINTEAWFDYNQSKMESISASLATGIFNQLRLQRFHSKMQSRFDEMELITLPLANFDSRVANYPKEEVANYFLARQKDAVRNSISMLSQSLYSHTELHLKNTNEMQEMCFQKGHNWNDLPFSKKRGSFIIKQTYVNGKPILIKDKYEVGDLWYQPNNEPMFDSTKSDIKGRLLECCKTEHGDDWCDIKINSIRTKWEVVETPLTFNQETFKQWL